MTHPIYTDNGAAMYGTRTRYFRDMDNGGVEWLFAADYAGPSPRWFGFWSMPGNSIAKMIEHNYPLTLLQPEEVEEL